MLGSAAQTMTHRPAEQYWGEIDALSRDIAADCDLDKGVPMAQHTSMKVGGPADLLVRPQSRQALSRLLRRLHKKNADTGQPAIPWRVLGSGSNLLVADDGLRGVTIVLPDHVFATVETGVELLGDWRSDVVGVRLGAGIWNAHGVRAMHKAGLVGGEFLALIPGSFGGAIAMNAGTRWGATAEILDSATLMLCDGSVVTCHADELAMSYRHCALPTGSVVLDGTLAVAPGDVAEAKSRIKAEKAYRRRTQPFQLACAGSYFANPEGDAAGRLIDAAGLKGLRWRGAAISDLHANFIVNESGEASASACLALMATARRVVQARFGVALRPEVKLLGFGPESAGSILDHTELPTELAALVTTPPLEDGK